MASVRKEIKSKSFTAFRLDFLAQFQSGTTRLWHNHAPLRTLIDDTRAMNFFISDAWAQADGGGGGG